MLPVLFRTLLPNLIACFRARVLIWYAIAIGLTMILVQSGTDWRWFIANRTSLLQYLALPAGLLGFLVPLMVPLALFAVGRAAASPYRMRAAFALAQAELVGWLISVFFKAFTGRYEPPFHAGGALADASHSFHFGFWEHGIFWGWPSSHSAVAFATASALIVLFPKNRSVRVLAALYAALVALGASVSFHWLSDVVAGLIMGTLAGVTVARAYLREASREAAGR